MSRLQLSARELATLSWFLEAAVVSIKESLEEEREEGVEDALRVRELHELEELRSHLHVGSAAESHELELSPPALGRLHRLAQDAIALCRGERPDGLEDMPAPGDASSLRAVLEAVRDRLQAHPDLPAADDGSQA